MMVVLVVLGFIGSWARFGSSSVAPPDLTFFTIAVFLSDPTPLKIVFWGYACLIGVHFARHADDWQHLLRLMLPLTMLCVVLLTTSGDAAPPAVARGLVFAAAGCGGYTWAMLVEDTRHGSASDKARRLELTYTLVPFALATLIPLLSQGVFEGRTALLATGVVSFFALGLWVFLYPMRRRRLAEFAALVGQTDKLVLLTSVTRTQVESRQSPLSWIEDESCEPFGSESTPFRGNAGIAWRPTERTVKDLLWQSQKDALSVLAISVLAALIGFAVDWLM